VVGGSQALKVCEILINFLPKQFLAVQGNKYIRWLPEKNR